MTADEFRNLALRLPGASEEEHHGHPDFRVNGRIFATLGPDEAWGMVKLSPEQQAEFLRAEPDVFQRVNGAWGRGGATRVTLEAARAVSIRRALALAHENVAGAATSPRGRAASRSASTSRPRGPRRRRSPPE
jgi:hypothetical protein